MSDLIDSIIGFVQMLMVAALPLSFLFWILLGFKRGSDLQKKKKETFTQICGSIVFVIIALPIAFFIGGMATDAPTSTMVQFWQGFFFIEGIPLLCLLLTVIKRFKQAKV